MLRCNSGHSEGPPAKLVADEYSTRVVANFGWLFLVVVFVAVVVIGGGAGTATAIATASHSPATQIVIWLFAQAYIGLSARLDLLLMEKNAYLATCKLAPHRRLPSPPPPPLQWQHFCSQRLGSLRMACTSGPCVCASARTHKHTMRTRAARQVNHFAESRRRFLNWRNERPFVGTAIHMKGTVADGST